MKTDNKRYDLAVLGIGNLFMSDDGLGVQLVQYMEKCYPMDGVCYIDGGTDAWGALWEASKCKKLIIVDAVFGGGKLGRIHIIDAESGNCNMDGDLAPHCTNAPGLLKLSGILDIPFDDVMVIGMEVKRVEWGDGLSPECSGRFPELVESVCREIERLTGRHVCYAGGK